MTPEPLRARRRRLLRDELERIAIRLFLERGFDAVSVDDIAAEAGMSGRTFFRYYATKDEILRRYQSGLTDALLDAFTVQPADVGALAALRAAYATTSAVSEDERERVRALGRLLATAPAVHARSVGETLLDDRLLHEYARRSGTRAGDLRSAVVIAAVSAAAQVGWNRWVTGDDRRDPAASVTAAIDALGLDERSGP
ncbi:TetR family transcriptional regulator [Gordonia polyisoprenivorans]|nr:TetR family transcriptional regulator [Gordonia polyisoprenivorans]